jgi:inosine-uridine nucleoside N-ribohydrolase
MLNDRPFRQSPSGKQKSVRRSAKLSLMLLLVLGLLVAPVAAAPTYAQQSLTAPAPKKLVIDTDPGVDDAAALIWLLSQKAYPVEVLGIVTVAGNTTVDNATRNTLLLLNLLGRTDIPVYRGAAAPLERTLTRTTKLIHGPDGLWFAGNPAIDISGVPTEVADFYCGVANKSGTTLLALGPLTNVANAVQQCPDAMKEYGEVVVLGGAIQGGNHTPVAEFNIWQDPEAAEIVFEAGLNIKLVPLDTFEQVGLSLVDTAALQNAPTPAANLLGGIVTAYINALNLGGVPDPAVPVSVPDISAVMFALFPGFLGGAVDGLVQVVSDSKYARGQTIIGFTFSERISMIADDEILGDLADAFFAGDPTNPDTVNTLLGALFGIFMSKPANATVVINPNSANMVACFLGELGAGAAGACPVNHVVTVHIGGCDTGVANQVVNGKSFSELIENAWATAKNRGQFISAVTQLSNEWRKAQLITAEQKEAIMSCATQAVSVNGATSAAGREEGDDFTLFVPFLQR